MDYREEIERLKGELGAVVLAHYYARGEVQDVADFVGDSLALSEVAAGTGADVIVFAGVHFMGETAKVLSPGKRVLMPAPEAGCSLAEGCPAEDFAKFMARYPDHTVVSYVNTSVAVKTLTDVCCTSSNALRVINSIPRERGIVFTPDRNLGAWLKGQTRRENMVLWDGACHVHDKYSAADISSLRTKYPEAKVAAHPECRGEVLALTDFVGSTAGILNYVRESSAQEFIIVTEPGILHRLRKENPGKTLIPAREGNECEYMKMVTLENIYTCMKELSGEILLEQQDREKALGAIKRMIEI